MLDFFSWKANRVKDEKAPRLYEWFDSQNFGTAPASQSNSKLSAVWEKSSSVISLTSFFKTSWQSPEFPHLLDYISLATLVIAISLWRKSLALCPINKSLRQQSNVTLIGSAIFLLCVIGSRAAINFWVACSLELHTHKQTCYFVSELCQLKAISSITSRAYQAYSAVTGVTGYGPHSQSWKAC